MDTDQSRWTAIPMGNSTLLCALSFALLRMKPFAARAVHIPPPLIPATPFENLAAASPRCVHLWLSCAKPAARECPSRPGIPSHRPP